MANMGLKPSPILGGLEIKIGDNFIRELSDFELVSVAVPRGRGEDCARRLNTAFGLEMPAPNRSSVSGAWRAVSMTADQILLMHQGQDTALEAEVQDALDGQGYTTTQTDAWVCLEVGGSDTLAALERICPIDLDAAAFPNGATARTAMEHLVALIIRMDTTRFLLCSASSTAGSFAHAIETSYRNVVV